MSYNPLSAISRWFNEYVKNGDFNIYFIARNEDRVVKPFLASLHVEYITFGQIILVKDSEQALAECKQLGFLSAEDILPKTPEFASLFANTSAVKRIYHKEYNLELYFIEVSSWPNVLLALELTWSLKRLNLSAKQKRSKSIALTDEDFKIFLALFNTLKGAKK
jgi:hypothetical protein